MSDARAPMPASRHRILRADARSLDMVDDESVQLIVTSPPYPMIAMWDEAFGRLSPAIGDALSREAGDLAFRLMHEELDKAWREALRVLAPGGVVCINIGDATRTVGGVFRLYSNHAEVLHRLERGGLHSLPPILWRKQTNAPNKFMGSGMLPPGAYVTLEHEYILVLRKGAPRPLTAPSDRARRRRSAYFWEERNVWFSDVWDFKGTRQRLAADAPRARSGAFPFELAYRLTAMFSLQGDAVLDPFLGTGTTSLACAALGRNSIGVEIDPELTRTAVDALAASRETGNGWTHGRLEAHREFVRARTAAGSPPRHRNAHHGFPVVTAQETDLAIDLMRGVSASPDGETEVEYATTDGIQMALPLELER